MMYNERKQMEIYDYSTDGGKNLILEYINDLSNREKCEIIDARNEIELNGYDAFFKLNTRQLRGKLWEIKLSQNRIMYVLADKDKVYFLNICKKQKGKAEKREIDLAIRRAKENGLM